MFWCTAPFFVLTLVLLPLLANPDGVTRWILLGGFELLAFFTLLGLYDAVKFDWCWRIVGALVFVAYAMYLYSMLAAGNWFGDLRRSSATALNALLGLIIFGYPGFMYAVFGRFTWTDDRIADPPDREEQLTRDTE
ncbi:MAG: hypothetical protein Aurels2KO_28140 [Aureliella sp.]